MPLDEQERQWRQYQLLTEVTKHGIELLLKTNIFYFAVTGAMLSFYVTRSNPADLAARLALCLPLLMGLCFAGGFLAHARTVWRPRNEIVKLVNALRLESFLDPSTLRLWLRVSAALYLVIVIGLLALIAFPDLIARPQVSPSDDFGARLRRECESIVRELAPLLNRGEAEAVRACIMGRSGWRSR
jgi:hypothetical protein